MTMRSEDLHVLRGLPLLAGIAEPSIAALLQGAFFQFFPAATQLTAEGDPSDFLYVLAEGAVELYAGWGGRETTMQIVQPVSCFILAAVLSDAPNLMSARTLAKSRILMIPAGNVRAVFARDAAFARTVVLQLAVAYRALVRAHKGQKLRNGVERLANYLLRTSEDQGGGALTLPVDKRTIAALLGMTPENLSRAFGTLAGYGVRVDGATIHLDDPASLRRLARPTPLIDGPEPAAGLPQP